ncbi:hypothetical protein HDU98_007546 [Podochytrium sp. JEL0797]|nr:hypothetical protein HDU98_007546 [Podochytrium sp. JEL0797]
MSTAPPVVLTPSDDDNDSQVSATSPAKVTLQQTPNVQKFLEEHVLFKGLDEKFLTTLSNAMQSRVYNPGEFVVRKGEIGRAMFFVLKGEVEVISEDGETVLNVMKEQSFFGEIGVLFSVPRTASCRAYGRCMILALTKERLQRVLQLYPKVAEAISILAEERYASHMKQKQAAMKVDFEDEINLSVTSEDLKKIPLFRDCENTFLHSLALKLNPVQYRQGESIVVKGEIANEMFFVVQGIAEVFNEENGTVFAEFHPGTFFGEVGIFLEVKRIASVRAHTADMTVFKLSKKDLDEVLLAYPDINAKIKAEAKQRFDLNQIREKSKLNSTQETATEVDVLRETLKQIPLFKGGSVAFFHELAMALKLRIFQPNELIIVADEPGSSMFFVADGVADVVSKDGKTVFGEFRPSSFFGEVALFYVINRTATIRARTVCTTLELHKDSLRAILAQHESLARTMLAKAEENYKLAIERQKAVKKLQESGDSHKFTIEDTIDRLSKVPTFKKTNPNFIRVMAQYTSVHRYKKLEMICKKGDMANEMYFVVSGVVEIVSEDGTKVFDTVQDGGFFGEVGLLRGIARTASVRIATDTCDVIQLNKTALETVLNEFPDSFQSIAIEADKRLQQVQTRKMAAENALHQSVDSDAKNSPDILKKFMSPFSKKAEAGSQSRDDGSKRVGMNLIFRSNKTKSAKKSKPAQETRSSTTTSTASVMSQDSTFDGPKKGEKPVVVEKEKPNKFGKMLNSFKVFGKKEPNKISPTHLTNTPSTHSHAHSTSSKASTAFDRVLKKANHIYDIPAGIIATSFQYLTPKERTKLRQLSHKFNAIVSDSRCWAVLNCHAIFTTMDPDIFTSLCERSADQLTTINLKSCWQVLDDELGIMTNTCPNIQHISLSNCWKITDRGISYLAYGLTKLRSLDVSYCGQLKGHGFADHRWSGLKTLNLTHCKQIGDEQLEKVLAQASEIESIKMRRCVRLTDFGVFLVIRHCRKITSIDLSDCDHVSDKCLKWIASSPSKLSDLRLSFCTRITNAGLYDLSLGNHTFEHLDLSHCQQITDAAIVFFSETIKHLRWLGLRKCRKITDGIASYLAKNATRLKFVDFTGCPHVTVAARKVLMHGLPGITVVMDTTREQRGIKSPEEANKPRAVEMLITQVYTSGPKGMGQNASKKKDKKNSDKKGRRKSMSTD